MISRGRSVLWDGSSGADEKFNRRRIPIPRRDSRSLIEMIEDLGERERGKGTGRRAGVHACVHGKREWKNIARLREIKETKELKEKKRN